MGLILRTDKGDDASSCSSLTKPASGLRRI